MLLGLQPSHLPEFRMRFSGLDLTEVLEHIERHCACNSDLVRRLSHPRLVGTVNAATIPTTGLRGSPAPGESDSSSDNPEVRLTRAVRFILSRASTILAERMGQWRPAALPAADRDLSTRQTIRTMNSVWK